MSIEKLIKDRLESLQPQSLILHDDSEQHIGHKGAQNGAKHFTLEIASPYFAGKSRVECHRLVYRAVADLIPYPVHALRIVIK